MVLPLFGSFSLQMPMLITFSPPCSLGSKLFLSEALLVHFIIYWGSQPFPLTFPILLFLFKLTHLIISNLLYSLFSMFVVYDGLSSVIRRQVPQRKGLLSV